MKLFFTLLLPALLTISAKGQQLKGIVTDGYRNRLIAVNVIVKGTPNATVTGTCGEFSILVDKEEFTILFHGMAYNDLKTYEIRLKKSLLKNDTIVFQLGHLRSDNSKCKKIDKQIKPIVIE